MNNEQEGWCLNRYFWKYLFPVLTLLFLIMTLPFCSILKQRATQPISVLIVTGMDIAAHNWSETTEAVTQELKKDPRMMVDVLKDPYRLDSVELSKYDVVFLNFNNWEKPDPNMKAEDNLRRFVAKGGGLVVMHFASGSFEHWSEYSKLAGKIWDRKNTHDPRGPFLVEVVDTLHPITHGIKSFETDDELYICLTGNQPVRLLAQARSKTTGQYHPMAFVLTYKKGRVFHTTLGHDARAVHVSGTAELIRRGVAWSSKRSVDYVNDRP
jgi:type 1 glutamine amidotransferase